MAALAAMTVLSAALGWAAPNLVRLGAAARGTVRLAGSLARPWCADAQRAGPALQHPPGLLAAHSLLHWSCPTCASNCQLASACCCATSAADNLCCRRRLPLRTLHASRHRQGAACTLRFMQISKMCMHYAATALFFLGGPTHILTFYFSGRTHTLSFTYAPAPVCRYPRRTRTMPPPLCSSSSAAACCTRRSRTRMPGRTSLMRLRRSLR